MSDKKRTGGDASVRRRRQAARKERAGEAGSPGGAAERPAPEGPVRLNKFLARAGVASRREADAVIAAGRVTVGGAVVTEMGVKVSPGDRVAVDGRPVGPSDLVYVLLNKPTDTITTVTDDRGRPTVMDLVSLPEDQQSALFPVGRLDRQTTGALLLTTDGELAHRLMHPSYGAVKLYRVRLDAPISDADLEKLRRGVDLDDGPARADHATFIGRGGAGRSEIGLQLHEGRNRQVRRMVEALGRRVEALDRVGYAGLDLDGLRRGRWRRLEPHEVGRLRRSVKLKPVVFG
ncbi:pseudouridine synthase [Rubrivirga sp. S365]|uniref:Pseudouridine synthase n=1 Tax=Rubrivirga litoralis TaxID=3075598 RepID=A0ABU3BTS3_9BACT|nr:MULTISPECIES: pseudouridine synthase [unclassified Rubrivirga]MDT0632678.1 pseudouridine synthase [Rubrivirga sp. F394]MDT7857145.1 pseudouridine synthase [Rubrivirga sp. S365]